MSDLWRNPDPTRPKKIRKFSLFQGCIPSHCNVNFQVTLLIKKCVFPKKKEKKDQNIGYTIFWPKVSSNKATMKDAWVEIGPAIIHLVRNFDGVQAKRARTR